MWATHPSAPTAFTITDLQIALAVQKPETATTSDTVVFDNLRIERNEGG
ncbi:MAG TPA: hypothetical protein VF634_12605 [Pyrinomonadaceae bacterium]